MAKTVARPGFPEYEDHRLTLEGMQQVLAEGGTVLHQGHVLQTPAHLPKASELTYGNAEREQAVKSALEKQIADLVHQMNSLGKSADVTSNLTPALAGHAEAIHEANLVAGLPTGDMAGAVDGDEQTQKYEASATGEGLHPTVGVNAVPDEVDMRDTQAQAEAEAATKRGRGRSAE